jgi:hypothetical protein
VKVDRLGVELARRGRLQERALDVELLVPLHKVVLDHRLVLRSRRERPSEFYYLLLNKIIKIKILKLNHSRKPKGRGGRHREQRLES